VWNQAVLKASIGLELSTVMVLVALFLFARHYEIVALPGIRALALGFLFIRASPFSRQDTSNLAWPLCSGVAGLRNVTFHRQHLPVDLGGSAAGWQNGARTRVLPRDVYYALTPEVNLRLRVLNERLSRLWDREEHSR